MRYCCIDLESIPSQFLPEGIIPQFDPTEIKTGAMGPEKAQEKIDKEKAKFEEGLVKKMSLDPDLCEVVCFIGKHSEEFPLAFLTPDISSHNLIFAAWDFITRAYLDHNPLVSFNGIAFDLPVLWHQAMIHNIPVSAQMYSDLTKKYDNKYHYDLMQILAGWDRTKWKPLDFYLKLFGIGEKTGDGSEVYNWWKEGGFNKIREYCENDVRLMAKLFEKLQNYIVKEIYNESL